jgi:hypothetical protein
MKTRSGILLALVVLLGGCGHEGPVTVPVRGRVTFDGAAPPAEGMVYFAPEQVPAGLPRRPGRGRFGTDGTYRVTSFEDGDGLVPGTYRVRVECWKKAPTMSEPGINYVAGECRPATIEIKADGRYGDVAVDTPLAK